MPGNLRLFATLIVWGWLAAPAWAQQPETDAGKEEELPSMELLEFLGEWETEDGEWIDPEELDEIALTGQEQKDDNAPNP